MFNGGDDEMAIVGLNVDDGQDSLFIVGRDVGVAAVFHLARTELRGGEIGGIIGRLNDDGRDVLACVLGDLILALEVVDVGVFTARVLGVRIQAGPIALFSAHSK